MYRATVIPHIEIKLANMFTANWLVSDILITALDGFVHNLGLKCNADTVGFSLLHHSSNLNTEQRGLWHTPLEARSATFINKRDYAAGAGVNLAYQPTINGNATITLVVYSNGSIHPNKLKKF